ncbi:MAG: aminotransferase class I/II-fold pyridoxal phosphate-dependent enzyme [Desulfobulbaceae bacterium]|nr:aminotransferase class I/II-fold pyridoxal phosphate-dependent enzyme [Desulfobulbaceae bacterium]
MIDGSSETIDAMMRLFLHPGDEFMLSTPTFELFPPRAELCNAKVVQIPVREGDLQYDVDAMLNAINERTKLILIINPNNPAGVFIEDEDLIRFCETGIPLCVDEAYLDYNPDKPSQASLIEKYPQVFLSVTFSKAYGFCGIRFGFVLGTEEILKAALDDKIYLKKIGELHGKTGYFRVTPGTDEENERFLKFIRAYFG